jgi:hypothetical protein
MCNDALANPGASRTVPACAQWNDLTGRSPSHLQACRYTACNNVAKKWQVLPASTNRCQTKWP